MTESEVVGLGKRRSRREINRLVVEFESSGLRQSEFCHKHGLALGTLQRGLKRRRREVGEQSEDNPLVEVKVVRTKPAAAAQKPALWKWCWQKAGELKSDEILTLRL